MKQKYTWKEREKEELEKSDSKRKEEEERVLRQKSTTKG